MEEENNLEIFGSLREWKISAQEVKDLLRKEEREAAIRKWGRD